jgi:hypothetical protein
MHQKRDQEHSQEYKKENLGNACRREGDAAKSQKTRDECYDQEYQCVIQHVSLLALCNDSACEFSFNIYWATEGECARKD